LVILWVAVGYIAKFQVEFIRERKEMVLEAQFARLIVARVAGHLEKLIQ